MNARFTIDGSAALETELALLCEAIRSRILNVLPAQKVKAILLGGGYGRGEGGVLRTPLGDRPYNDLEFYVLVRGPEMLTAGRFDKAVQSAGESLSESAGVEIEIKLLGRRKLERSAVSMFYYDLISGHRLIHGDESWITGCEHHRSAHRIPLHEATRLLMNRCSGLLFASGRLAGQEFSDADSDFVGRNLAKAKLAFGDVLLTMRGQYHWSCQERHKRLRKLAAEKENENLNTLVLLHEQGVDFKVHPVQSRRTAGELSAELEFLKELGRELWLKLESRRLGRVFRSVVEYSSDAGSKCPETRQIKNCLINWRTYGASECYNATYPRERLLRSLPLLLWHPALPETKLVAQEQLRTRASGWLELVQAYASLWRHFN